MRSKYRTPPIAEAIVEFRFQPSDAWDLTIPGKLHQQPAILARYDGRPKTRVLMQSALGADGHEAGVVTLTGGVSVVQLVDQKEERILTVGPDLLASATLRPYDSWESFLDRMTEATLAYNVVSPGRRLARVGVRYINRFSVPSAMVDLGEYFTCGPPTAPGLPTKIARFYDRVEFQHARDSRIVMTLASVDTDDDTSAFLLDLDVSWQAPDGVEAELPEGLETAVRLHDIEGEAFEAVITDKARSRFNEQAD